jgi:hypothetical protein
MNKKDGKANFLYLPNLINPKDFIQTKHKTTKNEFVRVTNNKKKWYHEEIKNPIFHSPKISTIDWKKMRQKDIIDQIKIDDLPLIDKKNIYLNTDGGSVLNTASKTRNEDTTNIWNYDYNYYKPNNAIISTMNNIRAERRRTEPPKLSKELLKIEYLKRVHNNREKMKNELKIKNNERETVLNNNSPRKRKINNVEIEYPITKQNLSLKEEKIFNGNKIKKVFII